MKIASFALIAAMFLSSQAFAGTLRIERQDGADWLTVRSDGSASSEILTELSRDFGFALRLPAKLRVNSPPSKTLRGDLRSIISRLLAEENYYIQNNPNAPAGIGKIVVLGKSAPGRSTGAEKPRSKKRRLSWSRDIGGAPAKKQKAKN